MVLKDLILMSVLAFTLAIIMAKVIECVFY